MQNPAVNMVKGRTDRTGWMDGLWDDEYKYVWSLRGSGELIISSRNLFKAAAHNNKSARGD